MFFLLGYVVVLYGFGLVVWDFDLGILYMLVVFLFVIYGIFLVGWFVNFKYVFLGLFRSIV